MITKDSILKMAHHIARRDEGYRDRRIMHPERDWFIALVCTSILFLACGAGAGYLYWDRYHRATEAYEVTIDTIVYNKKLIDRVLIDYRARKVHYESLIGASPSLPATTKPLPEKTAPPVVQDAPLKVE